MGKVVFLFHSSASENMRKGGGGTLFVTPNGHHLFYDYHILGISIYTL